LALIPKGILPEWPQGSHHEFRVELQAEQFCLSCHMTAKPGDVLGRVMVRSYLSQHLSQWWAEVQLTSLVGMGKIILHTVVLFFLLKVRMEPLLSLRSTITLLARRSSDLSHRAAINSQDEFGELARDLNLFLDRIDHDIQDLGSILTKVAALNERLTQVQRQMVGEYDEAEQRLRETTKQLFDGGLRWEELPTEWVGALSLGLASLRSLSVEKGLPEALQQKLDHSSNDLNALIDQGRASPQQRQLTGKQLIELSHRFHEISHFISEMAVLDEKMREIAEEGQSLLGRLRKM
jgi:methyl-accepting chemotaxis protein